MTDLSSKRPVLECEDLVCSYGQIKALHGVSLKVMPNEIVAVVGSNGSGKTTLLNAVCGPVIPVSGAIRFGPKEITGAAIRDVVALGIAHVPEHRQIFADLSVHDNLLLGSYSWYRNRVRHEVDEEIERVTETFPVLRERLGQVAGTMSGGEQQMLAIGRALVSRPKLLLLDEPSLGLAPLIVAQIFDMLAGLVDQGVSVLLIEQNSRQALKLANRGYVIEMGEIVLDGPGDELLDNPRVQAAYLGT